MSMIIPFCHNLDQFLSSASVSNSQIEAPTPGAVKCWLEPHTISLLRQTLESENGHCFDWCGEKLFLDQDCLVSNDSDSKLKQFLGGDIAAFVSTLTNDYKESIRSFVLAKSISESDRFVDFLCRTSESSHFQNLTIEAVNEIVKYFKRGLKHCVYDLAFISLDPGEIIKKSLNTFLEQWGDLDWIGKNISLPRIAVEMMVDFNVDNSNKKYLTKQTSHFISYFCKKRDFSSFSKLVFCSLSAYQFETENKIYQTSKAYRDALKHQGDFGAADVFNEVMKNAGILSKMNFNDKYMPDGSHISFLCRRDWIEVTLPSQIVQSLTIFLNKFNKEGLMRLAS